MTLSSDIRKDKILKIKIVAIVAGISVVCLIGGCGKDSSVDVRPENIEEFVEEDNEVVKETYELVSVDLVQEEFPLPAQDDSLSDTVYEDVKDDKSIDEREDDISHEDESSNIGSVEEPVLTKPFIIVDEAAVEHDRSAEYGIFSSSCQDLNQYLNDSGELIGFTSEESEYYSGRWAYPIITKCTVFDNMILRDMSDRKIEYESVDDNGNVLYTLTIYSGLFEYNVDVDLSDYEKSIVRPRCEIKCGGEYVTVYKAGLKASSEEGYCDQIYSFKIGYFTVEVAKRGDWLSDDDLQVIASNIHLSL